MLIPCSPLALLAHSIVLCWKFPLHSWIKGWRGKETDGKNFLIQTEKLLFLDAVLYLVRNWYNKMMMMDDFWGLWAHGHVDCCSTCVVRRNFTSMSGLDLRIGWKFQS